MWITQYMQNVTIAVLAILSIGGVTGVGIALAETFTDVTIDNDGPSSLVIRADTGQPNILFSDVGTRFFTFTMIDGEGTFVIGDGTAGLSRLGIDSSGNVGIGTINPTERLHVVGNIALTGDILPTGDLCIGTCT